MEQKGLLRSKRKPREKRPRGEQVERDVIDNAGSNSSEDNSVIIKIKNLKRGKLI